ncbi:MAG: hypothetical protein JWP81_4657 [Ferruginibacter sp.]|nr:hypothetical protein [Ferruginibacter sp.]
MKNRIVLLGLFFLFQCYSCLAQEKNNIVYGVFDGRTPCQELAKQLNVKTGSECIKIKWRLILYKDSITGAPTVYNLMGFVYRNENVRRGKWQIMKGTDTNPEAVVYQLAHQDSSFLLLLEADQNILLFLDRNKKLMVGNKDFSYALSRVAKKITR